VTTAFLGRASQIVELKWLPSGQVQILPNFYGKSNSPIMTDIRHLDAFDLMWQLCRKLKIDYSEMNAHFANWAIKFLILSLPTCKVVFISIQRKNEFLNDHSAAVRLCNCRVVLHLEQFGYWCKAKTRPSFNSSMLRFK
jgi:hypothetical protein